MFFSGSLLSGSSPASSRSGPNTPKGFVVTTIIGVAGALLATVVGDLVGLYRPGQGAGLIGATIGALVILFIWNRLVAAQVIPDHGL